MAQPHVSSVQLASTGSGADPLAATDFRIDWVRNHSHLLAGIREEFARTRPFEGIRIGSAIHLEPKTAALVVTLQAGGAEVIATGNLNSTQEPTVDYLRAQGATIIGENTRSEEERMRHLDAILDHEPQILLDNGGQMFIRYLERPYAGLIGGTEETTSGRQLLEPLRAQLKMPILVINDSPIKAFGENEHAVGQSVLESYMRFTNRVTNGERVVVIGYGWCGQGVAANFRGANSLVTVVDHNPVVRLRAHLDGFRTAELEDALRDADVVVTITGGGRILGAEHLSLLPDGVILANAGHFPDEIDLADMAASSEVSAVGKAGVDIDELRLNDGRVVHVLGGGHMVNLSGPGALGNSIESMDLGFSLQSRCLEAVATGRVGEADCVVPVPAWIDAEVASAYLARKA